MWTTWPSHSGETVAESSVAFRISDYCESWYPATLLCKFINKAADILQILIAINRAIKISNRD